MEMLLFDYLVSTWIVRGRVQTTWTNEGGEVGVAQMTTTFNKSFFVELS